MHWKHDKIEIQINDEANEVIEKPFESLLDRYQNKLETPMTGSDFIFDCLHYIMS